MLFQKKISEIKIGQSTFYQNLPINFIFQKHTNLCPKCIQEIKLKKKMGDLIAGKEENLLIQEILNKLYMSYQNVQF